MSNSSPADDRPLSELRNLGPVCERDLNAAGIFTAEQLKHLGPERAFLELLSVRHQQGRGAKCCNAAYLYALHGAIHDIDWRALPEKKKAEYKAFTADLRESGRFA